MRRSTLNGGFIGVNKTDVKKGIVDLRKLIRIKTNIINDIFQKAKVISSWYRLFERQEGKNFFIAFEERMPIVAWGGLPYGAFLGGPGPYDSGNTGNYIISSTDLNHPAWSRGGSTAYIGYTAPDGSTSAFRIDNPVRYQNLYVPLGQTYIYSYYLNIGPSNTSTMRLDAYYGSGNERIPFRQILPIESATPTYVPYVQVPNDGVTGWRRFAFEFYANDFKNTITLTFGAIYFDHPTNKSIYYWGPQVEKVS